ncbi:MAG: peptidase [Clostridium sp.]|uniref:peptidase n=1 Tax=Clostridium sp. TaxID=1506 RepID=UPI00303F8D40
MNKDISIMEKSAGLIINKWIELKSHERIVIITDELHVEEAMYLRAAAEKATKHVVVITMPSEKPQEGEPCDIVSFAMLNAEVIIAATEYSIITTDIKKQAIENGSRFLSLPLATTNGVSLLKCEFITMDVDEAHTMYERINKIVDKGEKIRITTVLGTDVTFSVKERDANIFSGKCRDNGETGSASFELYIPPVETFTTGTVILDASMGYLGKVEKEPFKLELDNGRINYIEASEDGKRLSEYIEGFQDGNMYVASELGIGLNKKAKCIGESYIEDESCYGTFHIGFGRNIALGGTHMARGHFDIVIDKPTVFVDDIMIIKSGEICT